MALVTGTICLSPSQIDNLFNQDETVNNEGMKTKFDLYNRQITGDPMPLGDFSLESIFNLAGFYNFLV